MTALSLEQAASPLTAAAASPSSLPPAKPSLAGLDRTGLAEALAAVGVPAGEVKMRVNQLHH